MVAARWLTAHLNGVIAAVNLDQYIHHGHLFSLIAVSISTITVGFVLLDKPAPAHDEDEAFRRLLLREFGDQ